MLAEIPPEQQTQTIDEVATEAMARAGVAKPPVDALRLAQRLGVVVAWDDRQAGRARLVQFGGDERRTSAAVLLRRDPRHERVQWAIAHEVGELLAERVFADLKIDPREAPSHARESIANALASRLLLPRQWFSADAVACGWDLFDLKARYSTASHELIARRMLDCSPPVIVSVFDNQQLLWRRTNLPGRAPPLGRREQMCRQAAHESGDRIVDSGPPAISAWAIHEPLWKREILRTEIDEFGSGTA